MIRQSSRLLLNALLIIYVVTFQLQCSYAFAPMKVVTVTRPPVTTGNTPATTTKTTTTSSTSTSSTSTTSTRLYARREIASKSFSVALAGSIWPTIEKFKIGPTKLKAIVKNILHITDWQDLLLLSFVAFALKPITRSAYNNFVSEEDQQDGKKKWTKRFEAVNLSHELAEVSLSVYAIDVISIILTTIGFTFPNKWRVTEIYAKIAYTTWAVQRFLKYKKMALCKFFKVDEENMGRVDILNRIMNGVIIGTSSLFVMDFMAVTMGKAMTGVVALGSAGTLAITLASQGLIKELLSGLFLTFSNKMYVGDSVVFGDGTKGKVLKLGLMETVLRGGDNLITRVPNTLLSSQKVSNVSRIKQSQVHQTLRFHYRDADKIPKIIDDIKAEIVAACPRLIRDGTRPFSVFWTNFNEDHLEVVVNTHFNIAPMGDAYWINRQNVLLAISKAIARNGVKLAHREPEVIMFKRDQVGNMGEEIFSTNGERKYYETSERK